MSDSADIAAGLGETLLGTLLRWAPYLASHLWETTLFAAAVLLLSLALRGAPAGTRYRLQLLASCKFLVPTAALAAFASSLCALPPAGLLPAGVAGLLRADGGTAAAGAGALSTRLVVTLAAVWLAGATALLWRHLAAGRRLAKAAAGGRPLAAGPAGGVIGERLAAARRRLEMGSPVAVRLSAAIGAPGVWGVRRPVLLLPEGIDRHLTPAELEVVLLHELEHVRRRDNLVAALHVGLRCLLWFHPLVWWLERRLLAERERACDERVVALCGRPRLYARSLLKVVGFGLAGGPVAASAATASNLQRRLEGIVAPRPAGRSAWPRRAAVGLALSLLVGLSLAASSRPAAAGPAAACTVTVKSIERFAGPCAAAKAAGDALAGLPTVPPPPPPEPARSRGCTG